MSPLLFVIVMEYLSRLIKVATKSYSFQFHPLCKRVSVAHLSFADDLLLFYKATVDSVTYLMGAFQHFSQCWGLVENTSKSQIVMAGVDGSTQARIMEIIKSLRLTEDDCK